MLNPYMTHTELLNCLLVFFLIFSRFVKMIE